MIDSTITSFQKNLLKTELDSVFSSRKFNGSISVKQNGELIYDRDNGFENFKLKKNLDSNSVFAIGSVSKQFTAVQILLLEEAGKLSTKDLVSKYLPEFQKEGFKNITVDQLLSHRSGISDSAPNLASKPGTEFSYSNKGFRYLGKIIEKVSGRSYAANAKELFAKAGMTHTFTADSYEASQNFAGANLGNDTQNSLVENMPKRLAVDDISVPAGGILSTADDLHRWNGALYNGKILRPATLQKMLSKHSERPHYILGKVGYGYGIMMNLSNPEAYFHSGYVKGSPSLLIYYPKSKTSVVILSNIADESKGKEGFFIPHQRVKETIDLVENSVVAVRREMLKAPSIQK